MKMSHAQAEQRLELITTWLEAEGRIEVGDVASRLGVAQETIRRDLRSLEAVGKLQRVHGGAVLPPPAAMPTVGAPSQEAEDADARLAAMVWRALPRTGTILLGAGRLTSALAAIITQQPPDRTGLTVVTASLDAAIVLSRVTKLSVYNIGGAVAHDTRAQEGDWALSELGRLHTDVSVVCPVGLSATHGLSQSTPAAAAIARAEVLAGRRVMALADSETLGSEAFVRFAGLEEIDHIAVTERPSAACLQGFSDRGVSIDVADDDEP